MLHRYSHKKTSLYALIILLSCLVTTTVEAQRGCCANHQGVCGCQCCDGVKMSAKCLSSKKDCSEASMNKKLTADSGKKENTLYVVKRVVDGDTLLLENGERVRLIGVDTPETVHPHKEVQYFGKKASGFTKQLVSGKKVRLEFDEDSRDKYNRLLAYVYLADGTFVNAELIKQGYGHAYTRFPFKYLEDFRQYEREARVAQRGLWQP